MLSVIIPANNEEGYISACLDAVMASDWPASRPSPDVIVVANGCTDNTAEIARDYADRFAAKGWGYTVLNLAKGDKMNALNKGDGAASHAARAYLDADVILSPGVLTEIARVLDRPEPCYASGTPLVKEARSWATRAYRRIYLRVPFMQTGVPGFGIYAVNGPGRARWGDFPDIISDDTFVRLNFAPRERHAVPSRHEWPMVEGFDKLVKVRRRQDLGVQEIEARYPDLLKNDDKTRLGKGGALKLAASDPVGFGVYVAVALAVRFGKGKAGWTRGR
ncbi:glycosyltransferase [Algicella marina]|uniref:Glycosyltransferase n=1 Tax=Algicella marina TaxID=2683284 RepID=A0A6P1SX29_9RHOB|nr:glycosyltransferase [Algicella marina]QHQ34085.1 glycosyltransferase [Algicella marina]